MTDAELAMLEAGNRALEADRRKERRYLGAVILCNIVALLALLNAPGVAAIALWLGVMFAAWRLTGQPASPYQL